MSGPAGALGCQSPDDNGPRFREPWEAQAFAMTLALQQRGLFSWSEWTRALAARIAAPRAAGDADLGDTYYHDWVAALEELVTAKGATTIEELTRYRRAWEQAAARTPHGQPMDLQRRDFEA